MSRRERMVRHAQDESGAVAVMVGISLILLVMLTAYVVDIGLARVDRQANQSVADLAATAGIRSLDRLRPDAYQAVCEEAWAYFLTNTPDADPTAPTRCAEYADASYVCSDYSGLPPDQIPVKSWPSGPYTFEIKVPVVDDDPRMLENGQTVNAEVDGDDPCDRIAISVSRARQYLFAGVAGFDEANPTANAVARVTGSGETGEFATLIVLTQETCNALTTDGQGTVIVQNKDFQIDIDNDGDLDTVTFPGMITADSDASSLSGSQGCGNNRYVVDAGNNGRICAGVDPAQAAAIKADDTQPCLSDPETLWTPASEEKDAEPADRNASPARIDPEPRVSRRITRAPVDHRYNCRGNYYPDPTQIHLPAKGDPERIEQCREGYDPHVDNLVGRFRGASAATIQGQGFEVLSGADCKDWSTHTRTAIDGAIYGTADGAGTFTGAWYFDCAGSDSISIGTGETFTWTADSTLGERTVVFRGDVSMGGSGSLILNSGASTVDPRKDPTPPEDAALDAIAFFQEGDLVASGDGSLAIYSTFTYFDQGTVKSTNRNINWIAPVGDAYTDNGAPINCTTYSGTPIPSCFENLAAWTNFDGEHSLGGGGLLNIDGVFFTPNAGRSGTTQFDLNGGANQFLAHAQFFSYRLRVTGGGLILMEPDPTRILEIPLTGGGLIR